MEFICVVCPKGCRISADNENISGYACPRGLEYAQKELTDPRRSISGTVRIVSRAHRRLPVKTSAPVPKPMIRDAARLLGGITVYPPVAAGDAVYRDILGTGVDFIASRSVGTDALNEVKTFVLDMDGTIYLGDRLFEYTPAFLKRIADSGREFYFFTNNSSKNAAEYVKKLARMGIEIPPEKMLISNQVIIKYLNKNYPGKRAYVVGTEYLLDDFREAGIELTEQADYVVLGFDTTLDYHKLSTACTLIRNGAPVFGVNPDFNCPTDGGFIPDCGSIAALVTASTGVVPEFFGKPSRRTLEHILECTGRREEEICIVGDRLYTDIATAGGSRCHSALVLTGESTRDDIASAAVKPELVCESIEQLGKLL